MLLTWHSLASELCAQLLCELRSQLQLLFEFCFLVFNLFEVLLIFSLFCKLDLQLFFYRYVPAPVRLDAAGEGSRDGGLTLV